MSLFTQVCLCFWMFGKTNNLYMQLHHPDREDLSVCVCVCYVCEGAEGCSDGREGFGFILS